MNRAPFQSIRAKLTLMVLLGISLALLAAAWSTYRLARKEIDGVFDYHLKQLALSMRDQTFSAKPQLNPSSDDLDFVIQVWTRDGSRVYASQPHTSLPQRGELGYATVESEEGRWRIYVAENNGQMVQVAQPTHVRNELAARAAVRTLIPFIILALVMLPLVGWAVGVGLAPLKRIAADVAARNPAQLDPLPLSGVALEAQPLVVSLNGLLARLNQALLAQRAFIADAAHELRTPLTALLLQVKLAERAQTATERSAALEDLKLGLARASHVVQQLLTLARQEPGGNLLRPPAKLDLVQLIGVVAGEHALFAESRQIDLGVSDCPSHAEISGDAEGLRILAANLIDNAIRYTPPGGRVDLSLRSRDGRLLLSVGDSGPGIAAGEQERVFDRFYRREGSVEPGSGLGLAIVRSIADRHAASISLGTSALGGLEVTVLFS